MAACDTTYFDGTAMTKAALATIVFWIASSQIAVIAFAGEAIQESEIARVFSESHDGWSVDEVLLDDNRRNRFLDACRKAGIEGDEKSLLEKLIHVRKSGKLKVKATKSNRLEFGDELVAAEIAARALYDRHGVHTDHILLDPTLRKEFDEFAKSILPDATPYKLRKAAFRLRKSRQLKPELVLRVTDWKKEILEMSVADARKRLDEFSTRPAVYIFRDKTGYLYIGQTNNLRDRMTKHLVDSDRKALTDYLEKHSNSELQLELHIFQSGSPAEDTVVREAYESEMIRSRKPRLNIAP
jgi:predicted GIY-YIG superfamily endonuclease